LRALQRSTDNMYSADQLDSESSILGAALGVLTRSDQDVRGSHSFGWSAFTSSMRLDAVSLLGMVFAMYGYQRLFRREIEEGLRFAIDQWEHHEFPGEARANVDEILRTWRRLLDPQVLEQALRRAVFTVSNDGRIEFAHKTWMELCIGWFIRNCIMVRFLAPLGQMAFYTSIYKRASAAIETNNGGIFSAELLEAAVVTEPRAVGEFALGNMFALFSYGKVQAAKDTYEWFLQRVDGLPNLARHVALASLGTRTAWRQRGDPMIAPVRRLLLDERLAQVILGRDSQQVSVATRSLLWCLRSLLGSNLSKRFVWPEPSENDVEEIFQLAQPYRDEVED